MINRILGLDFIDRFDAVDSPFKLMDSSSELAQHKIVLGDHIVGDGPFVIAGHCTIDPKNPNLFIESAHAVKEAGAKAIRGGVWKPRTMPYSYQGDDASVKILMEARSKTDLPVDTEVMDEHQLRIAVEAGVDILQVGARNALNYSLLKSIGQMTQNKKIAVLLKIHGDGPNNFAATDMLQPLEQISCYAPGNQSNYGFLSGYPDESITPLLKEPEHGNCRSLSFCRQS